MAINWTPVTGGVGFTGTPEYSVDDSGIVRWRGTLTKTVSAIAGAYFSVPPEATAPDRALPILWDWEGGDVATNIDMVPGTPYSIFYPAYHNAAGSVVRLDGFLYQGPVPPQPVPPPAAIGNDYTIQIGSLLLGPGTDYILHSVEGFGVPGVRSSDQERPQDHGIYLGADYLTNRVLTLEATVRGDSPAAAVANMDTLLDAWRTPTPTGRQPLRVKVPGKPVLYINGRPRRAALKTDRILGRRVGATLEYVSESPAWLADAISSISLTLPDPTAGRTYPRVYPLAYGTSTSGSYLVTNTGNFPAFPTGRITGPVSNPRLENITAGQVLQFNIALADGDYLDLDWAERTVLLNGTASRYYTLTANSAWWPIAPGQNEVRYIANTFQPGSTTVLWWRAAWL